MDSEIEFLARISSEEVADDYGGPTEEEMDEMFRDFVNDLLFEALEQSRQEAPGIFA